MNAHTVVWPSEAQLSWLRFLASRPGGESRWNLMPPNAAGRALGSRSWKRLTEDGYIASEFRKEPILDWYFTITDAGRNVLIRLQEIAA